MTTFNIAIPLKEMLPSRPISSYVARLRRVFVNCATGKVTALPVKSPGAPTSPPPTGVSSPGAHSNNQNPPSQLDVVRDLMAKNPKQQDSVVNYFANNDQVQDKLVEIKAIVKTGANFTSSKESLEASYASLGQVEDLIVNVYPILQNTQQKERSDGDNLVAKLKDIVWWQDTYHTLFTSSTLVSGLVAFASAWFITNSLAVAFGGCATVVAVVCLWVGKQVDSHMNELKEPVENCKGISKAITGANKLELGILEGIMELTANLKSDIQSIIQAMVGPEAAPVDKLAELEVGFQRFEKKIDLYIEDVKSTRKGVIHTCQ